MNMWHWPKKLCKPVINHFAVTTGASYAGHEALAQAAYTEEKVTI